MILLAPGGTMVQDLPGPSSEMIVGSVDGIHVFHRQPGGFWEPAGRALQGCFVSSLTLMDDGVLMAGTHGYGISRSDDGGQTWRWMNKGLTHIDIWVVKRVKIAGQELLFAGSLPANLFVSADAGATWRPLPAMNEVPSAGSWMFPPPPHIGHVKDIAVLNDRLYVGIEVGALLVSDDAGNSFRELAVSGDVSEVDIHTLVLDELLPDRIIATTGWGIIESTDAGNSWERRENLPRIDYPTPFVAHPRDPNLLFVAGGEGWPPQWYKIGRSRAKIARSRDGGRTWERLLGGLPDGQRPVYGALALEAWPDGFAIFAADTDGQVFESRNGGDHWTIVAEAGPVSKGDQHRGLAKNRPPLVGTDALVFKGEGQARVERAMKGNGA